MKELRLRAARTACARAQAWTLRERLLKLGAQVKVSVRRVAIHLPVSFPFLSRFRQIPLAFGASSGYPLDPFPIIHSLLTPRRTEAVVSTESARLPPPA